MVNIYNLNERIDFLTEEKVIGSNGLPTGKKKEVIYYSCWSNFKSLNGKEFIAAYTNNSKIIVSFRCRYCKKLSQIDSLIYKIKYKGKLYNIVFVNDISNLHEYIDFKCEVIN